MGILAHPVETPENFGIVTQNPDGSLDRLVEKPKGLTATAVGQHRRLPLSEERV